jgi:nucleolar protein 15
MIKHIPHGFYEKQMLLFFKQFGKVTNLKLYRSPKTGRSHGYAFVEFQLKEVAAIVAETMSNYLMFTKILKAVLVENPGPKIFMGRKFNEKNCPGAVRSRKESAESIRPLLDTEVEARKSKSKRKLGQMKKKMQELGIDCDIQAVGVESSIHLNETGNSMVSIDFSSDEEISVRMTRKSMVETVSMPSKKKILVKKGMTTPKAKPTPSKMTKALPTPSKMTKTPMTPAKMAKTTTPAKMTKVPTPRKLLRNRKSVA